MRQTDSEDDVSKSRVPEQRTDASPSADESEPTDAERQSLLRLLAVARSQTGQSHKVASFLLAWWNAAQCGGFDLADVWSLDDAIAQDILATFAMLTRVHRHPDALGYGEPFRELARQWRLG